MKARVLFLVAVLAGFSMLFLCSSTPASACVAWCTDGSFCETTVSDQICTCSCGYACCGKFLACVACINRGGSKPEAQTTDKVAFLNSLGQDKELTTTLGSEPRQEFSVDLHR